MKKTLKTPRKLTLSRDTLRRLDVASLKTAAGAATDPVFSCQRTCGCPTGSCIICGG